MFCGGRFSHVNTSSFVPANLLMRATHIDLEPSNLRIVEDTYYLLVAAAVFFI